MHSSVFFSCFAFTKIQFSFKVITFITKFLKDYYFGSFDEFHDSLQAHEQKSYQRYVDTFGDSGSDDFYSQIDILKQTRETQKRICGVYFN